jgi:hypothetical protein
MSSAKAKKTQEVVAPSDVKGKLLARLDHTHFYFLEYLMTLVGLAFSAILLDHAFYALFQYANDTSTISDLGGAAVKTVGLAVVWLPIGMVFYIRTRAQEKRDPQLVPRRARRFFLYLFLAIVGIAGAIFAYFAVRSIIELLIGSLLPRDALLGTFAPATLSAIVSWAIIHQFMQPNSWATTRRFIMSFGGVSIIIFILLFAMGIGKAQGALIDAQTSADLTTINNQIANYVDSQGTLPASINALSVSNALKARGSKYQYSYSAVSNTDYKLCAVFKTSSPGDGKALASPDFTAHSAGFQCFNGTVDTEGADTSSSSDLQGLGSALDNLDSSASNY